MNYAPVFMPIRNHLLSNLPYQELEALAPQLSRVALVSGQVIYERASPIEHAYFMEAGMVCLLSDTPEGELGVEVGTVGREGLVGCAAIFDDDGTAFSITVVQMPGTALRIPVARLRTAATEGSELRRLASRYLQALQAQAAQSSACHALHTLQQRAARWLLTAHDRAEGNELPLTQEYLSDMLGVRRPGVTAAAGALQKAGLISYSRGHVMITDRPGLERVACNCHRIIAAEYDRLMRCTNVTPILI